MFPLRCRCGECVKMLREAFPLRGELLLTRGYPWARGRGFISSLVWIGGLLKVGRFFLACAHLWLCRCGLFLPRRIERVKRLL